MYRTIAMYTSTFEVMCRCRMRSLTWSLTVAFLSFARALREGKIGTGASHGVTQQAPQPYLVSDIHRNSFDDDHDEVWKDWQANCQYNQSITNLS